MVGERDHSYSLHKIIIGSPYILIWQNLGVSFYYAIIRVHLDTIYFAENWKLKTITKIFFGYCSLIKLLCICLIALFMSHEQWTGLRKKEKEKEKKKANVRIIISIQMPSKST